MKFITNILDYWWWNITIKGDFWHESLDIYYWYAKGYSFDEALKKIGILRARYERLEDIYE